ncbi:MAG: PEP-CTERM system TPR-repeat protein PrsT, partial [Simplicispira sp.]|nr:PEP-CTERM system TPR-repeat protein PrsT [Simplicispira sp.]
MIFSLPKAAMHTLPSRFLAPTVFLAVALLASGCSRNNPDELIKSAEDYLSRKDAPAAVIQLKNALQAQPDSARARFLLGQALEATKDFAGAETEYKKAQDLGYAPDEVIPLVARSLLVQGKYRKLTTEYANPQLVSPLAQASFKTVLALAWQHQGNNEKFQSHLEEALKIQPDYAPAILELARARAASGDITGALALLEKMPAQSSVEHQVLKLRGDIVLFSQRDTDGALALYQASFKANPAYIEGYASAIQLLLAQGKADEAAQLLQALIKIAPNHPQTLYLQANQAYTKNDYKVAQAHAQKLLRIVPENARALELAGMTEFRLDNYAQAEALLAKALQLAPKLPLARRGLALTYIRTGKLDKAMATLPSDLDTNKNDPSMLAIAGQIHMLQGDADRAQHYFSKASSLDPKDPVKRTSLAVSRLMSGQTESVFGELQDIAASDDSVVADMALINVLLQRQEAKRALEAIDALEKKRPPDVLSHFLRGRTFLIQSDTAAARKAMEKVLEINPNFFPAIETLARLDNADKRPNDARARIEAAIQHQPGNLQAHLALVNLRATHGADKAELTTLLRKAVETAPGNPTPHLLLVDHFLRHNEPKNALMAAQQAVAAIPGNALVLEGLGRAQAASGDHNQAQSTFSRMAALQPHSPQPYLRMAAASLSQGNRSAATQSLRKALEIQPDLLQAQQSLVSLAMAANKPDDALAISRNVQKQRPKEAAGYLLEGDIHASSKTWDKAIGVFRTGLKQAPSPELALRLHAAFESAGKKSEADQWATQWGRTQPKDAHFAFYLASKAIARNDLPQALPHLERVIALQPSNAAALNN